MKRRGVLGAMGGLALCPLCNRSAAAAAGPMLWGYTEKDGPDHWGSLPNYGTCASGSQQSPIDLTGAIQASLPRLDFMWKPVEAKIVNSGHTVRVAVPEGNLLRLGGDYYEMFEFHFHAPSEHAVAGKRQAMEIHFVHRRGIPPASAPADVDADNAKDSFRVVGVLMKPGLPNTTFTEIARLMPQVTGGEAPINLSPGGLLPMSRRYFYYEGSLTTPGCGEVVSWVVMRDPITAAPADIARFTALYPNSARPLQPRNRRLVLES